ncbi:hypothetical protein GCM10011507_11430 [Edaphobacter acidisoli]|uniref:Uncharacterized protein n=1 Tax=Edaphobacter acidisoli TaxID=2040573 RepID=A0A916W2H3_9BACT|nr:DUF3592 domain-containing protein [Edaphobacter acidisoli]GGA61619.1 hypothetical protein GCM10011507_11430 [Edaphobacter acidisoli]
MSNPLGFIRTQLHRHTVHKLIEQAHAWPTATGEVNHWQVTAADESELTGATPNQIEARFHFSVNGEYYGGYFRSVAMGVHQSETLAKGAPTVKVRYDPTSPDTNIVLPEDNAENLPFRISTGA